MSGTLGETVTDRLARARALLDQGDWGSAFDLLRDPPTDGPRSPEEVELLATAAYGAGELEATISAWEGLHATSVEAGDHVRAAEAAIAVAMHVMMDTGLMSPVRGWLRRADRLLAGQDECGPHAMLAMVRSYERLLCGDPGSAGQWAARAIDLGATHDVPRAVAIGRIAAARVAILAGRVDEGMELLDEAAIPVLDGELDALSTGMAYCELICAMQWLGHHDRAQEWTDAMYRWGHDGTAYGSMHGRCRVHRAELLRLRGDCAAAEDEVLHACEELRPWMRREFGWPLTELGTIRLRKGDLAGAEEAFLAAHRAGWDPEPGLARLRLAQGDVDSATALVAAALEHPADLPWKERPPFGPLRRAPLLDAQVEIAAAAGDATTARRAADELTDVAVVHGGRGLQAAAALARGRAALAAGDLRTAIVECEAACTAWADAGAPYELADARTVLAAAHEADGNQPCARLEWQAARSTFEEVGAAGRAAAIPVAGQAVATSATAVAAARSAEPANLFRCDGDTRTIRYDGREVLLSDLKGMRHLERLLAEPGREFHVLDMVAVENFLLPGRKVQGLGTSDGGHAGPMLDDQAKQAYRRRLEDIDQDIEDAERHNDPERAALARADRDFIVNELARAVGLGGRDRRAADTSERARTSTTRVLRYAMARIAEHHPTLGAHLDHAVRTGTYCSYQPDPAAPVTWQV